MIRSFPESRQILRLAHCRGAGKQKKMKSKIFLPMAKTKPGVESGFVECIVCRVLLSHVNDLDSKDLFTERRFNLPDFEICAWGTRSQWNNTEFWGNRRVSIEIKYKLVVCIVDTNRDPLVRQWACAP